VDGNGLAHDRRRFETSCQRIFDHGCFEQRNPQAI
jgi:hypothetical protein